MYSVHNKRFNLLYGVRLRFWRGFFRPRPSKRTFSSCSGHIDAFWSKSDRTLLTGSAIYCRVVWSVTVDYGGVECTIRFVHLANRIHFSSEISDNSTGTTRRDHWFLWFRLKPLLVGLKIHPQGFARVVFHKALSSLVQGFLDWTAWPAVYSEYSGVQ